jgi:hypothetical protein
MNGTAYHMVRMMIAASSVLVVVQQANAQRTDTLVKLEHYALDTFTNGIVRLKNGTTTRHSMNYNLVTQEMIFRQGDRFLAIAYPETIDTVYFGERKFVPAGKEGFYEWLAGNTYPLFAEYTCTVKEPGTPVGIGTSNTTAATSIKSLINLGGAYALTLPDGFEVMPKRTLLIKYDNTLHRVKNEQQLSRLFPTKRELIRTWVKEHKTNFSKNDEVAMLVKQLQ